MFDYFWTAKTNIPENRRFQIFTLQHFLIIAFLVSCIFVTCYAYSKCNINKRIVFKRVMVWLLLLSEAVYQIELIVTKMYTVHDLPLQLCGLAIFMSFYHAYRQNKALDDILSSLCMPGAFAALIFCGWTGYSTVSFVCIHSFLSHATTVAYVCMQLATREIFIKMSDMKYTVLFMCGILPVMYFINSVLGTNFLFVNDPADFPIISWLASFMGVPGYVIGYFILALILVLFLHLIFNFIYFLERNKNIV